MKKLTLKIIPLSIIVIALIIIGSCNKNFNNAADQSQQPQNLNEISVSNDFDWNTSRNIELTIKATIGQIITISSVDQEIRYHRGIFKGDTEYQLTLNIPNTVTSLRVNNQTVNISSNKIICNLDK